MSLTALTYIATDLITLAVLVGILYAPRHPRKDPMAVYIGVNVGVLAVTLLLSTASVAAGPGLGLLDVLPIVRLRSAELAQHEVTYFLAVLALGPLDGIQTASIGMVTALVGTVIIALWTDDHPALIRHSRYQVIVLDHAITSETTLIAHLERALDGQVSSVEVQRLDLVDDTTITNVRFRVPRHTPVKLETATASDDIISVAQPTAEPTSAVVREAQTTQPRSDTRLNIVQIGSRSESVEAQPLTMVPVTQYITHFNSQAASSAAVASRWPLARMKPTDQTETDQDRQGLR